MTAIPSLISYALPSGEEADANIAQWEISPDRAVLLIHDMQRYFMRFFSPEMGEVLTKNISHLRRKSIELGIPIAYSAQPGGMTEEQRGLLKDFWGSGMKGEPDDRNVVAELAPRSEDWLLTKWRYSAFFRSDLLERMRKTGRDQIILTGVYAHVGIIATAIDAFTNDIQPFFIADATADFSEEFHRSTLKYASQRCAFVTTIERAFN